MEADRFHLLTRKIKKLIFGFDTGWNLYLISFTKFSQHPDSLTNNSTLVLHYLSMKAVVTLRQRPLGEGEWRKICL